MRAIGGIVLQASTHGPVRLPNQVLGRLGVDLGGSASQKDGPELEHGICR